MPHSSRSRSRPDRRPLPAPPTDFFGAVQAELAMVWTWATAPLKRLFEAAIRDGIRPPTTFEGLPPGQFPPIEAFKDELFGHSSRTAAPFACDIADATRLRSDNEEREAR